MKSVVFLFSLFLVSSSAFQAPHPVIPARKDTNINYVEEESTSGAFIKDEYTKEKLHGSLGWTGQNYQRAIDCTLNDVECDIDELYALADGLAPHQNECSIDSQTVEECMAEMSTHRTLHRILENQKKLKELEEAQRELDGITPAWYSDYRDFYHM